MEFADYLGVSFGTVNRWENDRFTPTVKAKRKLVSLNFLIKCGTINYLISEITVSWRGGSNAKK